MKKEERLMKLLGEINEAYLMEAEVFNEERRKEKPGRFSGQRGLFLQWGTAALAVIMTLTIAKFNLEPSMEVPPYDASLPKITLNVESLFAGGMGFEGIYGNHMEDLLSVSPYTWGTITKLPVFLNPLQREQVSEKPDETIKALKERLIGRGALFGVTIEEDDLIILGAPPEYFSILYEDEDYVFDARLDGTLVMLKKPLAIPDALRTKEEPIEVDDQLITYPSMKEQEKLSQYFLENYGHLTGFASPAGGLEGGHYNIYHKRSFFESVYYEEKSDPVDAMLSYHFNRTYFYIDHEEGLDMIRYVETDLSHKLADYPIISEREAKDLLEKGHYATSVPEAFPGRNQIRRVELMYRSGIEEKVFLPYYRILVEVPSLAYEGLNAYGAYYVPAIRQEYIEDFPLYDGRFN